MSSVAEAQSMFRYVPRLPDEPKGVWLRKAGAFFGLTFSQAKKIEYDEVKDLRASRLDAMRARLTELQQGAEKRRETLDALNARLAELRSSNGSGNPDGHSRRSAEAGGRSEGAGAGGLRESRHHAPVRQVD